MSPNTASPVQHENEGNRAGEIVAAWDVKQTVSISAEPELVQTSAWRLKPGRLSRAGLEMALGFSRPSAGHK